MKKFTLITGKRCPACKAVLARLAVAISHGECKLSGPGSVTMIDAESAEAMAAIAYYNLDNASLPILINEESDEVICGNVSEIIEKLGIRPKEPHGN